MNKAGLLASSFAAATLAGCVTQPSESSTAGLSFEELQATAAREPGTGAYVIDWDIVLHGDQALYDYWQGSQQGALLLYSVNGADIKWDATQKKNLKYCIGAGFGANKTAVVSAMAAATAQGWEKFADVKFVYDPTQDANCTAANANVLFDVNLAPAGSPYLARAFFPNSPRGQRNVLIEVASFNPAQTGNIPLKNILTHELGHTLGFRHEHIRPEIQTNQNCLEDTQYKALTAYDRVSTMHYPQCGSTGNTLALSALDQQGVAQLYGAPVASASPMTSINTPVSGATVPRSFTVSAAVVDTDLVRAELYIDGVLAQSKTTGPFEFQVANLALGQHQLEVRGTDATSQTSVSMITVTVASGTGQGGGTGGGTGTGGGAGADGAETDVTGGCSAGGNPGLLLGLGLLGLVGLRRRRR